MGDRRFDGLRPRIFVASRWIRGAVSVLLLVCASPVIADLPRLPALPPAPEGGVLDLSGPAAGERTRILADRVTALRAKLPQSPLVVVFIRSLAAQDALPADGWTARAYSRVLLAHWSDPARAELASASGAGDSAATASWDSTLLVLLSLEDQKLGLAAGPRLLSWQAQLDRLDRVLGHHLAREEPEAALLSSLAAVEDLLSGRAVALPGSSRLAWVFAALFFLLFLSTVNYLRKGRTSLSYGVWSRFFSLLGAAIAASLSRGVDLGDRLRGARSTETSGRLVIRFW
jgi:hypothetical protein